MKKILTFALAALMIISMTGCAGNDNTQKEQEKVVTSFFDNIKEYKLDELEKLGTDDYTDVLDISSITDGFKNFEDENVYGESFVKETENFVKKVFDKLIKEYKITFDDEEENTVLVKGKRLDEKSIDMTSAQENIELWISGKQPYPCISVCISGEYAAINYFQNDAGDMWLSYNEENQEDVTFMAAGEEWEPDVNAVISINSAFSCIREFCATYERPCCIQWQEL